MVQRRRTKSKALSKKQRSEVRSLIDEEIDDKGFVYTVENNQLFHNIPKYTSKLLQQITKGVNDGDQGTGATGLNTCRIGERIALKNINIRLWLSNKYDRPNVMYKGILFWYSVDDPPANTTVFMTQSNKMLDRYNTRNITVVDTFILNSATKGGANYANTPVFTIIPGSVQGREASRLITLNKSYKGKKILYDSLSGKPKMKDLAFAVFCYDAFGTLQTDNIASFAWQSLITFQDA